MVRRVRGEGVPVIPGVPTCYTAIPSDDATGSKCSVFLPDNFMVKFTRTVIMVNAVEDSTSNMNCQENTRVEYWSS